MQLEIDISKHFRSEIRQNDGQFGKKLIIFVKNFLLLITEEIQKQPALENQEHFT